MSFFVWSQLALVCLLGAMSPGPSLALIIRNSINYNRLSGILASIAHGLGICIYAIITFFVGFREDSGKRIQRGFSEDSTIQ